MGLDDHRLEGARSSSVVQVGSAQSRGPVLVHKQSEAAVFVVAGVGKVLALDDLLHDVVGVDARVVHTAVLPVHLVLLPPGGAAVGQEGRRGRGRGPLRFGGRGRWAVLGGGGRGHVGMVGGATGGAATGGGVPMVAEVSEAGAARVACAVT